MKKGICTSCDGSRMLVDGRRCARCIREEMEGEGCHNTTRVRLKHTQRDYVDAPLAEFDDL